MAKLRKRITANELYDIADGFYKKRQFDEIINLLPSRLLKRMNDARLYRWRGISYNEGGQWQKAIGDFTREIEIDPVPDSYYCRGLSLNKIGKYRDAAVDFSKAISLEQYRSEYYADRAISLAGIKEYESAMADFNKAIALNPTNSVFYNDRGAIYNAMGEWDKALSNFNNAILIDGKVARYFINRGRAFYEKKEYQNAINDFNAALVIDNSLHDCYNRIGITYDAIGDLDKTIFYFSTAIELSQDSVYYNNRGLVLIKQKKIDEAIKDFTVAIFKSKNNSKYYFDRARAYKEKGKLTYAVRDFSKAIDIANSNPEYFFHRGTTNRRMNNIDDAIFDFTKAIQLKPNEVKYYVNRAMSWKKKSNHENVIADCSKALELQPDIVAAIRDRAYSFGQVGEYDKAINDYTDAIRISRFHFDYSNRALLWQLKNEYEKAIEDYSRAIELNDSEPRHYYYRGVSYGKSGLYLESVTDFTKAISLNPQEARYYWNRGLSFDNLKEYDKAIVDYSRAISLDKKNAEVYFKRGNVYYRIHDHSKALKNYSKSILLDSTKYGTYFNKGLVYLVAKKYKDAIACFDKAIALSTKDEKCYFFRGNSYFMSKQYKKALADYNMAIQINPNYDDAKFNREIVNLNLRNKIVEDVNCVSSHLNLFVRILHTAKASNAVTNDILKVYLRTKLEVLDKIRAYAAQNVSKVVTDNKVAHYTKLNVAGLFATNEKADNKLRYYNAIYMNDPEEGVVVLDKIDPDVRACFENANTQEEDNIYLGSFLPASRHQDELVMWRTYGKDENQVEGGGCSIVIDEGFFDTYNARKGYVNPEMLNSDNSINASFTPHCLYSVIYYNKQHAKNGTPVFSGDKDGIIENSINKLNANLKQIIKFKKDAKSNAVLNTAIDKIVYHIISEIRFFFKSADYEFENELRVIQMVAKNSKLLNIDSARTPQKVYIDSTKNIQPYMDKVILGPKVPNHKQWLYLDVAMKKNNPKKQVSVEVSACKYQ